MDSLENFRRDIDTIDDRIVDLLAERFAICRRVAAYKLAHGIPVHLPDRIAVVKTRCAARGSGREIRPEFVSDLYDLIIEETCRTESATQARLRAAPPAPAPAAETGDDDPAHR